MQVRYSSSPLTPIAQSRTLSIVSAIAPLLIACHWAVPSRSPLAPIGSPLMDKRAEILSTGLSANVEPGIIVLASVSCIETGNDGAKRFTANGGPALPGSRTNTYKVFAAAACAVSASATFTVTSMKHLSAGLGWVLKQLV